MKKAVEIWVCTIKDPMELLESLSVLSNQVNEFQETMHEFSVRIIYNGTSITLEKLEETKLSFSKSIVTFPVYINLSDSFNLSAARNYALNNSMAEWGVYVDDDVILSEDFLKFLYHGINQATQNDCIIIGGRIELTGIPNHLNDLHKVFLSQLNYGAPSRVLTKEFVNGACFGVNRKKILEMSLKFSDQLGRKGSLLLSGEESLLLMQVREMGGRIWYENDLLVRHIVEPERLTSSWLLRRVMWEAVTGNIIRSNLTKKEIVLHNRASLPSSDEVRAIFEMKKIFESALSGDTSILDIKRPFLHSRNYRTFKRLSEKLNLHNFLKVVRRTQKFSMILFRRK